MRVPGLTARAAALAQCAIWMAAAAAEPPGTSLRSVVNGVSMDPAVANVAPGGIIAIQGTNLASAFVEPSATPLPVSLDSPTVEVRIGDGVAPLFFVSPTEIKAQVPWGMGPGWTDVVVSRGGEASPPMPLLITATEPGLFTEASSSALIVESGSTAQKPANERVPRAASATAAAAGDGVSITAGATLTVFGAGLGATNPPATTGATAAGSSPVAAQRAFLGGLPVEIVSSELSSELVGVYGLRFKVPEHAEPGEVLHWFSGDSRSAGILGAGGALAPRYLAVPSESSEARRIDMTDLNPYFVAVSGTPGEEDSCFRNTALLDFRRSKTTPITDCLLPSYINAPNTAAFRPFELAWNTPVLAALAEPTGADSDGVTNRLVLVDSAGDSVSTITLESAVDRLQSSPGGNPNLRLERSGGTGQRMIVTPAGEDVDEITPFAPLPAELSFESLTQVVAQPANFGGGYRMRFLGPADGGSGTPRAVLYDSRARAVGNAAFPQGWVPLVPARAVNAQGQAQGNPLAPTTGGFRGEDTAFVLARTSDGTKQAVVAFRAQLPDAPPENPPDSIAVTASATELPGGTFVTECSPAVRWSRIALTRKLAVAAAESRQAEFARLQDNRICSGDRLVLFDTTTSAISTVSAPGRLQVNAQGAMQGYLYFADAVRDVALEAPRKMYVFDGAIESFSAIELPGNVGVTINQLTQAVGARSQIVALATGGAPRTNPRTGATLPPQAGNRGLLVVDLARGSARHLALPSEFQRVIPGGANLVRQGRRGFGLMPLTGRVFARGRRRNIGPGQPGGSAMLVWDAATGTATELPMPEGGFAVGQRIVAGGGGGGAANPLLWDYQPKSAAFAYGVFNQTGDLISVGVVGP